MVACQVSWCVHVCVNGGVSSIVVVHVVNEWVGQGNNGTPSNGRFPHVRVGANVFLCRTWKNGNRAMFGGDFSTRTLFRGFQKRDH